MNNILKTIELDLYSPTSYEVIKAQQGDKNSRIIEFILYDKGEPYNISSNVSFRFDGHRGDGSSFTKSQEECITRSGNSIQVTLLEDILYYAGTIEAKLVMYESSNDREDTILSTIPFKISCIQNPCNKTNLSPGEKSIVNDLILQMDKFSKSAEDVINNAQDSADIASSKATEAKNSAVAAKSSETNAKSSADNAKTSEINAETSKTSAATSATTAENKASEASTYLTQTKNYYEQSKDIYDNFSQAGTVTGVKGNAESTFRGGNVNITKANIGLGNVDNTADANKSVAYAVSAGSATKATQDGDGYVITNRYAKFEQMASSSGDVGNLYTPIYSVGRYLRPCRSSFVHMEKIFDGQISIGGDYVNVADLFNLDDNLIVANIGNGVFECLLRIIGYHSYKDPTFDPFVADVLISYNKSSGGVSGMGQTRCLALGSYFSPYLDIKAVTGQCNAMNVGIQIKKSNGGAESTLITKIYNMKCKDF